MIVLHILLWILRFLLYFLGAALLLLFLLSLFPVKASLEFETEFALTIRYLFLRLPVLPAKEEVQEPEPEEEEKQEEPAEPAKPGVVQRIKAALKREGFAGFLEALGELIRLACGATAGIVRRIKLRRFDLYLSVAGADDAAAGALLYGKVSAGVYGACGGLFTLLSCSKKGVTVDLDYNSRENLVKFSAELSIRPFWAIKEVLALFFKGLRPLKRIL